MALTPEQLLLVTAFRLETEDLFKALTKQIYFKNGVGPYANEADVLATIAIGDRIAYLTLVNIMGVDYWFTDSTTLVPYVGSLSILDNSVALSKLVNMTGPTFLGKQTGTGSPQVLSVANVLSMLGLTDVISTLSNKVDKATGYSLVLNTLISQIHAPGSDDQDLTAIEDALTELYGLINSNATIFKVKLPAANSVAGRLAGLTEGVNYPTGWTLAADDKDLIVTHNLGRSLVDVTVWSRNLLLDRKEIGNAAYSGLYETYITVPNAFTIEALATIETEIIIKIILS